MPDAINKSFHEWWKADGVKIPGVRMLHDARTINTAQVRSIESYQSQLRSSSRVPLQDVAKSCHCRGKFALSV